MRFLLTLKEKIKKFGIFRGNFLNPEVADPTQDQKNFMTIQNTCDHIILVKHFYH